MMSLRESSALLHRVARTRVSRLAWAASVVTLTSTVMLLALSDHDAASRDADGHAWREAHALLTVELHGATQVPRSYFGLSTEYWALAKFERRPAVFQRVLSSLHAGGRPVRFAHRRRFG